MFLYCKTMNEFIRTCNWNSFAFYVHKTKYCTVSIKQSFGGFKYILLNSLIFQIKEEETEGEYVSSPIKNVTVL